MRDPACVIGEHGEKRTFRNAVFICKPDFGIRRKEHFVYHGFVTAAVRNRVPRNRQRRIEHGGGELRIEDRKEARQRVVSIA
ncbi:hypothetical protein SDC9_132112 [bioreactor metagenome]|uniref:Uncharacterized protein n=1 Tax=bioreactor metagenome TaxID=1076179 RepID=A0A645D754_9ZZZZ